MVHTGRVGVRAVVHTVVVVAAVHIAVATLFDVHSVQCVVVVVVTAVAAARVAVGAAGVVAVCSFGHQAAGGAHVDLLVVAVLLVVDAAGSGGGLRHI